MYYTCPRRLGTIRSSLARGMRHRHMMILKSVTFTNDTDSPPRAPPLHAPSSSTGKQSQGPRGGGRGHLIAQGPICYVLRARIPDSYRGVSTLS